MSAQGNPLRQYYLFVPSQTTAPTICNVYQHDDKNIITSSRNILHYNCS